jgi:hypothetical protein
MLFLTFSLPTLSASIGRFHTSPLCQPYPAGTRGLSPAKQYIFTCGQPDEALRATSHHNNQPSQQAHQYLAISLHNGTLVNSQVHYQQQKFLAAVVTFPYQINSL